MNSDTIWPNALNKAIQMRLFKTTYEGSKRIRSVLPGLLSLLDITWEIIDYKRK